MQIKISASTMPDCWLVTPAGVDRLFEEKSAGTERNIWKEIAAALSNFRHLARPTEPVS